MVVSAPLSDPSSIDSGLSEPVSEAPESSCPSDRPPLLTLMKFIMLGFSAKAWLKSDSLLVSLKLGGVKGDPASPSNRSLLELGKFSMLLFSKLEDPSEVVKLSPEVWKNQIADDEKSKVEIRQTNDKMARMYKAHFFSILDMNQAWFWLCEASFFNEVAA